MKTVPSPSNLHSRCGVFLVVYLALALATLPGAAVASAQTASPASHPETPVASARPQAAAKSAPHADEEESEAKPNDANHQGIKIHGHWKIDIKNPDGSLASTHEFENSLYDGGSLFSYLLTSRATSGEAAIEVDTLAGTNCSNVGCPVSTTYQMSETSTGYWANSGNCGSSFVCVSNLNIAVAVQVAPIYGYVTSDQVVLSGSAVANTSGSIYLVSTKFASCSSATGLATLTPAQCHTGTVPAGTNVNSLPQGSDSFYGRLTQTQPSSPITFVSGQTMQVTVTLSFS